MRNPTRAEMAELVDALGSGPSDAKALWRFESSSRHHFFSLPPHPFPSPPAPSRRRPDPSPPMTPASTPSAAAPPPLPDAVAGADLRAPRDNMIERQIRAWEVLDDRVLALYRRIPREDFVPAENRDLAFCDAAIPVGFGQAMLEPKLEARILQEMNLQGGERVLHAGTGSGFFAALLAQLCAEVVSVEIVPELADAARKRIAGHGVRNISVRAGDAMAEAPDPSASDFQPDAMVLTGSVPMVGEALRRRVRPGGFLMAVVGQPPVMTLRRMDKTDSGQFIVRNILETSIPALQNAPAPERFRF